MVYNILGIWLLLGLSSLICLKIQGKMDIILGKNSFKEFSDNPVFVCLLITGSGLFSLGAVLVPNKVFREILEEVKKEHCRGTRDEK